MQAHKICGEESEFCSEHFPDSSHIFLIILMP